MCGACWHCREKQKFPFCFSNVESLFTVFHVCFHQGCLLCGENWNHSVTNQDSEYDVWFDWICADSEASTADWARQHITEPKYFNPTVASVVQNLIASKRRFRTSSSHSAFHDRTEWIPVSIALNWTWHSVMKNIAGRLCTGNLMRSSVEHSVKQWRNEWQKWPTECAYWLNGLKAKQQKHTAKSKQQTEVRCGHSHQLGRPCSASETKKNAPIDNCIQSLESIAGRVYRCNHCCERCACLAVQSLLSFFEIEFVETAHFSRQRIRSKWWTTNE